MMEKFLRIKNIWVVTLYVKNWFDYVGLIEYDVWDNSFLQKI